MSLLLNITNILKSPETWILLQLTFFNLLFIIILRLILSVEFLNRLLNRIWYLMRLWRLLIFQNNWYLLLFLNHVLFVNYHLRFVFHRRYVLFLFYYRSKLASLLWIRNFTIFLKLNWYSMMSRQRFGRLWYLNFEISCIKIIECRLIFH